MKPLDYRSVSSKGAGRPRLTNHHKGWWNETKWMRWVWRNGGMKFVVGKTGETPRKTYPDPVYNNKIIPRNPHGVTETRTRDPGDGRRAPNRLRHEAAESRILPVIYSCGVCIEVTRLVSAQRECYWFFGDSVAVLVTYTSKLFKRTNWSKSI